MKRSLEQYANCDPYQVVSGSHAQALFFAQDAKADIAELSTRIVALEAENQRLRDALRSASVVLPKYAMKGATAGDDEALEAVIEQVGEALEPDP